MDQEKEILIAEYNLISKAFSDLHTVQYRLSGFYFLIIATPFVIAPILIVPSDFDILNLPEIFSILSFTISFLGLIISLSMIHIRFDQILYARAANGVRAGLIYNENISQYFVLPSTDDVPDFIEYFRYFFWLIIFIGLLNSTYFSLGYNSFFNDFNLCYSFIFFILHIGFYLISGYKRKSKFNSKIPTTSISEGNF